MVEQLVKVTSEYEKNICGGVGPHSFLTSAKIMVEQLVKITSE